MLSGGCRLLVGGAKHFLEFLKMIFNYLFIFRFYVSTAAMSPYLTCHFELGFYLEMFCLQHFPGLKVR